MIKKITKEIQVCDVCEHETTFLSKCIVCKNDYCLICQGIIPGCMVNVDACKNCAKLENVNEIVKEFAIPIAKLVNERNWKLLLIKDKGNG